MGGNEHISAMRNWDRRGSSEQEDGELGHSFLTQFDMVGLTRTLHSQLLVDIE